MVADGRVEIARYATEAASNAGRAWLALSSDPEYIPGGKPVPDVPSVPIEPRMSVGPTLVIGV